jgi:hypothetical protein
MSRTRNLAEFSVEPSRPFRSQVSTFQLGLKSTFPQSLDSFLENFPRLTASLLTTDFPLEET